MLMGSARVGGGGRSALGGSLLLLAAGAGLAAVGDEPRPRPTQPPAVRPMSDDYRVLLMRSIFSRDHNRAVAVVRNSAPAAVFATTAPAAAETNFVLKGLAVEDGVYTAFFEQAPDATLLRVHLGDALSHGRVTRITLDGVDYAVTGLTTRVTIGQALDGGYASLAATRPATEPSRPDAPSTFGTKPSWWRRTH